MMQTQEEYVSNNAAVNYIPVEENNDIADQDDLHEIQVDDDINEPDPEADYAPGPGADDKSDEEPAPETDED